MKLKSMYTYAMTEAEIERDLDEIFKELGYVEEEYPFERDWRTDGCTSKMILAFCRKHCIICHIMNGSVKSGNEVECHIPVYVTSNTPRVDFFIRDDHCFWYGKDVQKLGLDKRPAAANGISQIWEDKPQKTEDDTDQEYFKEFACKQTLPVFACASKVPPISEWKRCVELYQAAPTFQVFMSKDPKVKKGPALYFYHPNLEVCESVLRKQQEYGNFSIEMKYGKSPDIAELLILKAEACPKMIVKRVPQKCELYQAIFEKATELLNLAKDKQLVYKGEFPSQVCERLRLEVSKSPPDTNGPKRNGSP